jgi:hypothetical protein
MLKAKLSNSNTLVFGLSDKNMELLKEGKPIMFNLREMGLAEDANIIIFNGRTEASMATELEETLGKFEQHEKTEESKQG